MSPCKSTPDWDLEDFDPAPAESAEYIFIAEFPGDFDLADGVALPEISVFIFVGEPERIVALADASTLAGQINGWTGGGAGALSASVIGNTVTVGGIVTGATNSIDLDIDPNVTIVWKATLSGEVSGGIIESIGSSGLAINSKGTVTVSGGTVKSNFAITVDHGGVAAYLHGTCTGSFEVFDGNGMIVEVDRLEIPSVWNGTSAELTRKDGGNSAVWDTITDTTQPKITFTL